MNLFAIIVLDNTWASFVGVGVVAGIVAVLAYTLWVRRVPGLSGRPGVRALTYLLRYASALEWYGMRKREMNARVDELRAELGSVAPTTVGGLLDGLGPPRRLAAEMCHGVYRVRLSRAITMAALVFIATMFVTIVLWSAFLNGVEAAIQSTDGVGASPLAAASDGLEQQVSLVWPGLRFDAVVDASGDIGSMAFTSIWLFILPAVGFLLGGAWWRGLGVRRRAETPPPVPVTGR